MTLGFVLFSESESSSSDDDDQTINDEDIRKALQPSPSVIKRRERQSSTSSTEETKTDIPARPHANVQVERSEEIQTIRSQLPIITEEQSIMEAIHDNLVVLICGETGKEFSYKSNSNFSKKVVAKQHNYLNFFTKLVIHSMVK
jgi:hypothetical protein